MISQSGRQDPCSPDVAQALFLVRGFGHPGEVAARYQPVWAIIDPGDARSFLRVAIIGAGVWRMAVATFLPQLQSGATRTCYGRSRPFPSGACRRWLRSHSAG